MNKDIKRILLVGNPNVGKSVIFSWMTGRYVTVSNYPGTTVEIAQGMMRSLKDEILVVDTPGINSLLPQSEDERITRDILLKEDGVVIQVADAKNIERALHITLGLIEMDVPFMLVLNMMDEADERGIKIDAKKLEERLGIPVIETIATSRQGLDKIKTRLKEITSQKSKPQPKYLQGELEQAVKEIEAIVGEETSSNRAMANMILTGDIAVMPRLQGVVSEGSLNCLEEICRRVSSSFKKPISLLISEDRSRFIDRLLADIFKIEELRHIEFKDKIAASMVHPLWGFIWAAFILSIIYLVVGRFVAGNLVDWLNGTLMDTIILPPLNLFSETYLSFSPLLQGVLLGPYGIITMGLAYALVIVLPIVAAFFFLFGILEDVGYLPRLAVMLNKTFKRFGLQGKAVLPMVLGFGCGAMATIVTRILETRKERIIATLLLALGIPCSAQLGVILGLFGSLPVWAPIVWGLTIITTMLVVGRLASKMVKGSQADFIMEVPPIRFPVFMNLLKKTASRTWWYLREAVPLFILGALGLFILNHLSFLSAIERALKPLVGGVLGLPQQAAGAFLMGFIRRDYGAAYFYDLFNQGMLDDIQAVVAIVVITLFVPCVVSLLVIIKERGLKMAVAIFAVVMSLAFIVGGIVRIILRTAQSF